LLFGTAVVLLLVLLYGSARLILMDGFARLETQAVETDVQRAIHAIESELEHLYSTAADWAYWDDTYFFAQGANASYIDDNLTDSTFANLKLNLILILNTQGQMVFGQGFDLVGVGPAALPGDLDVHLQPGSPLLTHDTLESVVQGLVMVEQKPMLVVSLAILTNDSLGPAAGPLGFGRYLDEQYVADLAATYQFRLNVQPVAGTNVPPALMERHASQADDYALLVQPLSETQVAGYTLLDELYGEPAVNLTLDFPRDIYAQGQTTLTYFLLALLVIGAVIILVSNVFAERLILRRLRVLSDTVSHIQASGDLSTQVALSGRDELAQLAGNFNQMIGALQESQRSLATAHDQLEQRVQERTVELEQANALLRQEMAEREQTQRELAQTRDQALEALRLKTRILANVSHDARTPLNVITLRSETLKREYFGPLNAKQHEILDSVMASSKSLLGFVNNLLQEAQLQSDGDHHLRRDPFHPGDLLDEVRDSLLPLAERKGLTFDSRLEAGLPDPLYGDIDGLKQILFNLVENAIKFTDQGGITLRLFQVDAGHWGMEVADTGRGIPKEAHDRIFDAFWQVDGSLTREQQGVGLGLSIVRQLATLMKAEIKLRSEVGRGTVFTIVLPQIEPEVLEGQGE